MARTVDSAGDDLGEGEAEARRPGRPRDPGYDKAILHATLEILFEKGYAGLTIDGVAAKTGVGRPTIYRRWPSKPALVIAALGQSVGLSPTPDTGSLRDDLLAVDRVAVNLRGHHDDSRPRQFVAVGRVDVGVVTSCAGVCRGATVGGRDVSVHRY